ncbi:GNAT family N-acetyltransferase [Paractinoplanes hotanensis]|uniref:GNAT family N-acetyltransferase n=1 Tax=Paractinoplanes hotanensis TaxID=2906497 RepID=A0ABT0YDZ2_9ACTN|nr:GNAT family N-acetyltransferase [Actinoplanes hotanensis]MCM4084261.1 GNAT family N-acetyltransferase [Actinoplanes hotanensis]
MPAGAPIVRATLADRDVVAEVLASAFADDPVFSWLYPDRRRVARLRLLFGALAAHAITSGHTYLTADGATVALWSAPHSWKVPVPTLLRAAPRIVASAGVRLPRVLRRLSELEGHHARAPQDHWYLEFIGTRRSAQGRGHGSRLLADGIDRCDSPIYLDTPNPRTLPFYRRAGFTVTEELSFPTGPPQWALWRQA